MELDCEYRDAEHDLREAYANLLRIQAFFKRFGARAEALKVLDEIETRLKKLEHTPWFD